MQPFGVEQLMHIARQHYDAGRLPEAEGLCRQVLKDRPKHAEASRMLGVIACRAGQFDRAFSFLCLAIDPGDRAGFMSVAVALQREGHLEAAVGLVAKVIELHPNAPDVLYLHGNLLQQIGRLDDAIAAYQRAIAIDENLAEVFCNLGVALNAKGDFDGAIAAHGRAIKLQSNRAELHANLGAALASAARWDLAINAYLTAIRLHPALANAHYNLANALRATEQFAAAIAAYREAIRIKPDFAEAHSNLGVVLRSQGRLDDALAAYDKAIELAPESPEPHWNRAVTLLLAGDFERGWAEYEWRHRQPWARPRRCTQPRWDGHDLAGKTILLHAEQGLGDTIQFVRYAPLVAARGGKVLLECQSELRDLLGNLPNVSQVVPAGEPLPAFDVHCPLMSLPGVFATRLDAIPDRVPYLEADARLVEACRPRFAEHGNRPRVGLVWAGRPEHLSDCQRSMLLAELAPLAAVRSVDFYSLQTGRAAGQISAVPHGLQLIDLAPELNSFANTAALVHHLDLVISVDTAVAHLAGAMGKPVWLLLPFVPDWRWMLNRSQSPWYPTMRLFRQSQAGQWSEPINRVAQCLKA